MHIVKSWHLFILVVLSSILSTGLVFGGWMYIQHINTPLVVVDKDAEKCLQVVNFANGDAYNCDDVGVMLRRYRKTYDIPVPPTSLPAKPVTVVEPEAPPAPPETRRKK